MGFLEEFDSADKAAGNALLRDWIETKRDELFEELREYDRPILKFWSKNPGNPDKHETDEGWAYLITKRVDVKYALAKFSMHPYVLSGAFVLSIDDPAVHGPKRSTLQDVIRVSPPQQPPPPPFQAAVVKAQVVDLIDKAVEDTWQLLVSSSSGNQLDVDVNDFANDVALRFTGRFFGIPEPKIFGGTDNLKLWSGEAFEDFIWKIHARHFDTARPAAGLPALGKIGNLIKQVNAASPREDTVIGRLFDSHAHFASSEVPANLIGLIQGLVPNVVVGTCYALNRFFETGSIPDAQHVKDDPPELMKMMHEAHKSDTPGPFLPRRGDIAELPSAEGETGDNLNFVCAVGAALTDPAPDPAWDIRMGWGRHLCIGRWIGDEIMVRALAQIVQLNDLSIATPLKKQWGWIVTEFKVSGKIP